MNSSSFSYSSPCNNDKIDIWTWLQNLPSLHQWKHNSISICICSSTSSSSFSPSLGISICKSIPSSTSLFLSIIANFHLPISLWTSKPIKVGPTLSTQALQALLINIIQDILNYGPTKNNHQLMTNLPTTISSSQTSLRDSFNLSLLSLVFLVCIYEAPRDLRPHCLLTLKDRLTTPQSRDASCHLMRAMGSTLEERWMRSINLAIANWKAELMSANKAVTNNSQTTLPLGIRCPCPLFSYAMSTSGMWKLQVYCPVIAMEVEDSSGSPDEQLMMSLNYHQLEGVVQLNYQVVVKDKWVDVIVNIDNIRLSIVPLVSDALLNERGAGASEKHFPSRISLHLTPSLPSSDILSVSVSQSTDNRTHGIEHETGFEASFDPPKTLSATLKFSETTSTTLQPWKFEDSAHGDTAGLSWFLHDIPNGREVFSSRPSKMAMLRPRNAWFRDRYAAANRPFTRQGGVVFAGDEYGGKSVCWKVDKSALGRRMEWEVVVCVGASYWPNRHRTFYNETRRAHFRDTFYLHLSN
ncbi:hypothetical protein V2J09_012066 [Rumex salicifolius]